MVRKWTESTVSDDNGIENSWDNWNDANQLDVSEVYLNQNGEMKQETDSVTDTRSHLMQHMLKIKDCLEHIPDANPWHIQDILPKKEFGILAGEAGHYKTWISLHMAISLATGTPFLEKFPVEEPKKVLYIDQENGINVIADRIKKLTSKDIYADIADNENLTILCNSGIILGESILKTNNHDRVDMNEQHEPNLDEELWSLFHDNPPKVIIVDGLQRVLPFDIDRGNFETSRFFQEVIRPLIKQFECSFVFLHHLRKPAGYSRRQDPSSMRGASELNNTARFVYLISHKNVVEGEFSTISLSNPTMNNFHERDDMIIRITINDHSASLTYLGRYIDLKQKKKTRDQKLRDYIQAKSLSSFTYKEITTKDAMEDMGQKHSAIKLAIQDLLKNKKIKKGEEKKGRQFVYEVLNIDCEKMGADTSDSSFR